MDRHDSLYGGSKILLLVAALSLTLILGATSPPDAEEPGTIGIGFGQLYSESQANKRGPMVVLQVMDGLPGAKAGIQRGDIIVGLNGSGVGGRDLSELIRKEVHGPVGGSVRLKIARPDGSESEVTLTRVTFPPH